MIIALAWMHVLKMTLATCFMTLFLKKFRLNELTCIYIGVIYAFCSHQIVRGFWWTLGDECYIAVLILWAAECYYREKKWKYIPLAIAVLSMGFGVYYSYLYGLELFVYATLRYFYDKHSIKEYPKFILTCGGLYLLGALMMSIVLLDHTNILLDTARYVDTQTYSSVVSKFEIVDPKVLFSAVLSIFDVNCSGVFHLYTGALNYLERPMFYCGLACLFLIPHSYFNVSRKATVFSHSEKTLAVSQRVPSP